MLVKSSFVIFDIRTLWRSGLSVRYLAIFDIHPCLVRGGRVVRCRTYDSRSRFRILPTAAVYLRQLSLPSLLDRLMSTSESWGVNRHTTRCTGTVSVVLRLWLVTSWGLWNGDQRCPMGLKARERTLLYFLLAITWHSNCAFGRRILPRTQIRLAVLYGAYV